MTTDRRVRGACLAAVLAILAVLGGTVISAAPDCPGECQTLAAGSVPQADPPSPRPAALTVAPVPDARDVDPVAGVDVRARSGEITGVTMVNDAGKPVPGVLGADGTSWRPTVPLGYGRTYTMSIVSVGPGDVVSRQTSSFSTVTPQDQTTVTLGTTGGTELHDGATYGVGIVVVARFDEPVTDKAAAERHLVVSTTPKVAGSWNWIDDQTAHWRPEKYYTPGTSVTVAADVYGVRLGDGLYGQQDEKVTFTVGDSHVSIADDTTKQVSVFDNGKLVRTMPTSMGMGGTETIGATTISFWTPPGVYTVMDKANPVIMDSSTFGLPIGSRLGYREAINYATRISTDGIYLHQLDSTVWAQGNTDTSHGCLNLNGANARWFYDFSVPGDVVEVRNTGGAPLQLWQNGDWSVPWAQWRKGSALPA
ncbi:MAG: L,D-transpeptidase family protein [Actinobacteria bacterium]|nr:L,D-transpeptidase family protein [Actinomycetota bacterium]